MRPHWQDVAIFAAAAASIFVAAVAAFFLVLTFKDYGAQQAKRDSDRVAILAETDAHRCRSEQILRLILEHDGIPVPGYPAGVTPPNCGTMQDTRQGAGNVD